jgi:Zn2+/Cd2+-exporting ATPase
MTDTHVKSLEPTASVDHAEHGHDHDHGTAPKFLPHWVQERWTLLLVGLAGLFYLIAWLGGSYLGLPQPLAIFLFVLSYLAGGYDITLEAIPMLLKGKFSTDILMLAAAIGAALLGQWQEGAFLLFLFSLGHAGEHYALDRARNAVSALGALMPKTAQVRRNEKIVEMPVETLAIGDVVVVRPGDRIPVDGTVVDGVSSVDQSPITGESVPVDKNTGDQVFAGTINKDAALEVRVNALAADNTLARVMKLVAEAQSQQSNTQRFIDRFTQRFVPAVFIATALIVLVPTALNLLSFQQGFYRGMLLLVAASPCALALGTPAAVLAGIAQAARNGVLIKGGVHLENLGRLKAIAFDKTGTITSGQFGVKDVIPFGGLTADKVLQIAGAVEQQSNHPLAQAVVKAARDKNLPLPSAEPLENIVGRGVRSEVDGEQVYIGSLKLFREVLPAAITPDLEKTLRDLEANGRSTMSVSKGHRILGVIGLADLSRSIVPAVMKNLRSLGVEALVMLTGDNRQVAERIAAEVGLTDVQAELMPEHKLTTIQELEKRYQVIGMVGDGINDAPALAAATVGIAMGGAGTAVALETADVALMSDDLGKLPFAVGLSRATRQIINQNLAISLGVIALLIVTSVLAIIPLGGAVILHEGSTLVVVLNALRLLGYRQV